jgi:hypothetical protein
MSELGFCKTHSEIPLPIGFLVGFSCRKQEMEIEKQEEEKRQSHFLIFDTSIIGSEMALAPVMAFHTKMAVCYNFQHLLTFLEPVLICLLHDTRINYTMKYLEGLSSSFMMSHPSSF